MEIRSSPSEIKHTDKEIITVLYVHFIGYVQNMHDKTSTILSLLNTRFLCLGKFLKLKIKIVSLLEWCRDWRQNI
jgi:hypothetical protein